VMHDTTLDALCVKRPRTFAQLRGIPGIGERKIELYGQEILEALERFHSGARATATPVMPRKKSAGSEGS